MVEPFTNEMSPDALPHHPAMRAWCEFQRAWIEPGRIEALKVEQKAATYRLNGVGPSGASVIAKRCRTPTARVERMIYTQFLPRVPVPRLACYGFLEEPGGEFCWLFLEEASGEMYSPQCAEHRALAGRWLGTLDLTPLAAELQAQLPDRRPDYYLQRLRTVRAKLGEHLDSRALGADELQVLRTVSAHCDALESRWDEVKDCCAAMPSTLVHCDFVVKNLRVRDGATGPELLVFDWELAGWGVPATDLAQFVGHTVSPDLSVYASVMQRDFGDLDARIIQRVADCGRLLRLVDELYWASALMTRDTYEFLKRPVVHFRMYEPQLAAALAEGGQGG